MSHRSLVSVGLSLASALLVPALAGAQSRPAAAAPTFTKDVAPIFYKNCTVCHRPGEIGPFSMLTYAETRPWVKAIATQVSNGTMPPWHADPAYSTFVNDRRLSAADKETILKWVAAGAPEGNRADLPTAPSYPSGWAIGQPDAVFQMTEAYPVPASGTIDYKHFEVPTNLTEDKWIQAFEFKPDARAVVHHIIVYARPPRRPAPAAAAAPPTAPPAAGAPRPAPPFTMAPGMNTPPEHRTTMAKQATPNDRPVPKEGMGAFVGGFAPGQAIRVYQEGTAMKLPAGSTLIFQVHYTAGGKPVTDQSKIGFVWAKSAPRQELVTVPLINGNFTLPAGTPNTQVDAQMTFNVDTTIWSILPHTHVRGREWKVEVTYPDGRKEVVLAVPKYDFNWQTDYVFKEPLKLPKGTTLKTMAWYDNSSANKSNPDPSVDVHWGEQTWEEMQFTALTMTIGQPESRPTGGQ
jgi:mono/diheme cytochrome c family protein